MLPDNSLDLIVACMVHLFPTEMCVNLWRPSTIMPDNCALIHLILCFSENGILSLYNISKETSGYYICTATNKIRSAQCNITVSVYPREQKLNFFSPFHPFHPSFPQQGLGFVLPAATMSLGSTGTIIGIVAAIVGVIAIIVIVYCCCCRKKKQDEQYAMG